MSEQETEQERMAREERVDLLAEIETLREGLAKAQRLLNKVQQVAGEVPDTADGAFWRLGYIAALTRGQG